MGGGGRNGVGGGGGGWIVTWGCGLGGGTRDEGGCLELEGGVEELDVGGEGSGGGEGEAVLVGVL